MSEWNEAIQKMQAASAPAVSAKEKALLPCPFCGGAPSVSTYQDESLWSHNMVTKTQVSCRECDISFESEPGYEFEAPDAWNRRAALSSEGEAEPVAWVQPGYLEMLQKYGSCSMRAEPVEPLDYIMPLYASPPSAPAGLKVEDVQSLLDQLEKFAALIWLSDMATAWRRRVQPAVSRIRSSLQPDTQAAAASAPAQEGRADG